MPAVSSRTPRNSLAEQPPHIDRRLSEAITQPTAITLTVIEGPPPIVPAKPRRQKLIGEALIAKRADATMWNLEDHPGTYLPSPETIAAECAAIRAGWSEDEYRIRAAMAPDFSHGDRMTLDRGEWRRWYPPGVVRGLRGEA